MDIDSDEKNRWRETARVWWRDTNAAAAFLTRVPFFIRDESSPRPLASVMRVFPLVGAGIGMAMGGVLLVASWLSIGPTTAAILAVGAGMLITGGLHEDGLADLADGFGGGRDRADKLRIMRDSRIGSFGVLALIVVIGLKVSALSELDSPWAALFALVGASALSRSVIPVAMRLLRPARADGLGHGSGTPKLVDVQIAVLLGAALALPVGFDAWFAGVVASALIGYSMIRLARRQIGGHTGDVLGALQAATETAFLVTTAAVFS